MLPAMFARPGDTRRQRLPASPVIYVALGFVSTIVLGVAQLYYFGKLQSAIAELSGFSFAFAVTFATSFLVFCWIAATRYMILLVCAYFGWTHAVRPKPVPRAMPLVSVLLPAYNEAARIDKTLESILASSYPRLEVIVIDDGSTDHTFEIAGRYAGQKDGLCVRVLRKPNGGKSTALNIGFRESQGALVMCVDADSQLERNAISRLAALFQDATVGAAAGQVRVRNRSSTLTRLQALEYTLMNGVPRLAQSNFGHVLIAPGPVAMFRRTVLHEIWARWGGDDANTGNPDLRQVAGPWEHDTFAEDCDVTLNTLLLGKRVIFEPAAISYTTSPGWLLPLLNQRYRWTRGNIQAVYKSWRRWHEVTDPPRALPLWLAIFMVESFLWPLVNIYGLAMLGGLLIIVGQLGTLIPWYLILLLIEVNAAAFSVRTMGDHRVLVLLCPLFRSIYSVLLDVNTLCASIDQVLRRRMSWGG
jgi:cellulose synthase/poly-beta-1,6-N-acetylglucosamine synthase-like glycosyltransferase